MIKNQSHASGNLPQKWGDLQRHQWLAQQFVKRSYWDEVVKKIQLLAINFQVEQYGALSLEPEKYPLFLVKTRPWDSQKKTILVTGGVHGYETSGVQGALSFLKTEALRYSEFWNIVVAPCISPWGYETINRWNPQAIDPNRSFYKDSPAEECAALMAKIASLETTVFAHFDLHETTDTDNRVSRPALAARDGIEQKVWNIPDGFYLVGDSDNPRSDFQKAMIASVKKVTHIAPADEQGRIIGELLTQEGVINYETKKLGLCTGFSDNSYCTTTEVYPDSPRVSETDCVKAQVAAIIGGLDYLLLLASKD